MFTVEANAIREVTMHLVCLCRKVPFHHKIVRDSHCTPVTVVRFWITPRVTAATAGTGFGACTPDPPVLFCGFLWHICADPAPNVVARCCVAKLERLTRVAVAACPCALVCGGCGRDMRETCRFSVREVGGPNSSRAGRRCGLRPGLAHPARRRRRLGPLAHANPAGGLLGRAVSTGRSVAELIHLASRIVAAGFRAHLLRSGLCFVEATDFDIAGVLSPRSCSTGGQWARTFEFELPPGVKAEHAAHGCRLREREPRACCCRGGSDDERSHRAPATIQEKLYE